MDSDSRKSKVVHSVHRNRKTLGEILFFFFLFIFLLIIFRLSMIAIFKNAHNVNLVQQTRNLYTQNNIIKPKRGTIYDANGQPLAEDSSTYSVYLVLDHHQRTIHGYPLYVTNKHRVAKVLSKYLPVSAHYILRAVNPKYHAFQVSLGNSGQNISLDTKKRIEKEHLPGVHFTQQQSRLYPNGTFASHLIGLAVPVTSTRSNTSYLRGQMGIEDSFNKPLSGHLGYRKTDRDDLVNPRHEYPVRNGDDVYTTLDYRLQSLLEDRMSAIYKKDRPESMGAMLMNAKTGDILAASQRPSFNATTRKGINDVWRNVLTQDLYEPGSTMKAFTIAASINSHHYRGNNLYNSGKYYIDGKLVPDWNVNGWGRISYNKGFALSSNVAMAHLERNMGSKTWHKYINRFKLMDPVNIGLNNDVRGLLQFDYPIEQANTAFGQGIEVNFLQMMRGLSAISNDGTMLQPRLVAKLTRSGQRKSIKRYPVKTMGNPISKKTAQLVRKHMEDVVYKSYGIGHAYQIPGYRIAAKTGTAQISNGKRYASGNDSYLYSVAGMAPANNPKYVLYLTMKKPRVDNENTAALGLAQIFKPVMKQALNEDKKPVNNNVERMPDLRGKTVKKAKHILKVMQLRAVIQGKEQIVKKQSIPVGDKVIKGNRIVLLVSK